jgi:hypothetical protein
MPVGACMPHVMDLFPRRDGLNPPCICQVATPGVFALALSADQLLLACISHEAVRLYSVPQLVHEQQHAPLHTIEGEVQQFAFTPSKAAADLSSFLSLSSDRVLRCGSLLSGTSVVAEHAAAACWSPDGAYIAYAQGNRVCVTAPDWKQPGFEAVLQTAGGPASTHSVAASRMCCNCPHVKCVHVCLQRCRSAACWVLWGSSVSSTANHLCSLCEQATSQPMSFVTRCIHHSLHNPPPHNPCRLLPSFPCPTGLLLRCHQPRQTAMTVAWKWMVCAGWRPPPCWSA